MKSAYYLAIKLENINEASRSDCPKAKAFWNSIWGLKCWSRVKIVVWKIFCDIILSLSNIKRKGIDTNSVCLMCRAKEETTKHVIWECKSAKKVWVEFLPKLTELYNSCRIGWTTMDY